MPKLRLNLTHTETAGNGLAWLSLALAVVGGITATATWVGTVIAAVVGVFWAWVAFVLIVVVGLSVVLDVVLDGIPNRKAIYGAIVWPSLWLAIQGRLGTTIRGGITEANDHLDREFGGWVTDTPVLTTIAVVTITAALFYAHKYAHRFAAVTTPGRRTRPAAVGPAPAGYGQPPAGYGQPPAGYGQLPPPGQPGQPGGTARKRG